MSAGGASESGDLETAATQPWPGAVPAAARGLPPIDVDTPAETPEKRRSRGGTGIVPGKPASFRRTTEDGRQHTQRAPIREAPEFQQTERFLRRDSDDPHIPGAPSLFRVHASAHPANTSHGRRVRTTTSAAKEAELRTRPPERVLHPGIQVTAAHGRGRRSAFPFANASLQRLTTRGLELRVRAAGWKAASARQRARRRQDRTALGDKIGG